MSPTVRAVPAIHPSQFDGRLRGEGGTISATGLPKRVIRIGLRVLRTCSSIPRHLALNSDMATSFIVLVYTMVNDYGQASINESNDSA